MKTIIIVLITLQNWHLYEVYNWKKTK